MTVELLCTTAGQAKVDAGAARHIHERRRRRPPTLDAGGKNSREETSSKHSEIARVHTEGTKCILIGPVRHATGLSLPFFEFRELLQRLRGFHMVLYLAIRARQQKKTDSGCLSSMQPLP